jgi:hypothetical protein
LQSALYRVLLHLSPVTCLSRRVGRIYKQMARRAGLSAADAALISGHSTRVGAAQDMLPRYGEPLPAIMQAGRWKTSYHGRALHRQARRAPAPPRASLIGGCRSRGDLICQVTELVLSGPLSVSPRPSRPPVVLKLAKLRILRKL